MRTLGAISIHDVPNDVVLCKPSEVGLETLGEGDFASYDEERCQVSLNENKVKTPEKAKDLICHEYVHGLLQSTGAITYLKEQTGLSGEAYHAFEENLVGYLGPAVASSVYSLHGVCDLELLGWQLAQVKAAQ